MNMTKFMEMGSENIACYELHLNHMVIGILCDVYRTLFVDICI